VLGDGDGSATRSLSSVAAGSVTFRASAAEKDMPYRVTSSWKNRPA
jgi:hypothetical protein